MDWKAWVNHKAGGAKLTIEEAEQYVTELILTRSIAVPSRNGNKECLCNPTSLRSISRSRRVMQTLGTIVKLRHVENYYQAIYLLQFLHDLYPNATSLEDYGKLLVYLKVEVVIYTGCCSVLPNRIQAAQWFIKQLFENYKCKGYSEPDKQCLESLHNVGHVKLNQILATSEESHSNNLSMDHFASLTDHKAMCRILEEFFKGIDDILPPPTIIQIIQDSQKQKLAQEIGSLASNYVTRLVIPTQALTKGKSLASKKATDSLKTKTNLPSTGMSKTGQPSKETTASNDAHESTQNTIFKTARSNDTSTEENEPEIENLCISPDFKNLPPKMTPLSPKMASDSSQSQDVTSPITQENVGNGNDYASCELKFISTHSRMKKSPLSSKRFVPLVRSMRCQKCFKRSNEEQVFNGEIAQPKIKRVRIVLSPLAKEEYMHHLKLTSNKSDLVKTSSLQRNDPHHKETDGSSDLTLTSCVSSGVQSTSSDEDYEPPDISDTTAAACTERKRKSPPPVRYVASARYESDPQNRRGQSCSPNSKSLDRIGSVTRSQKKRKSVPPVRYAPFTRNTRYQRDMRSRERLHTPDSESVISETVTSSSIGPDSPLVNLHT